MTTDASLPKDTPLPPGLAEELSAAWRAIPGKGLFFGLLAVWVCLFHLLGNSTLGYIDTSSLFGWLNYAYAQSEDDEFGRYVPLVVLGLCWWKRDDLRAVPAQPSWWGVLLIAVALVLHVLGFAIQQTRLSVAAFYFGVYGLIGAAWGWRMLSATFFPFFLLVFCVPLGTLGESITFPLRLLATHLTTFLSQSVFGIAVIQNGNLLFDAQGTFRYEVAAACGGLRSLTATLALASIYGFVTVTRAWKRGVILLSAFPLAVAGNVLRLLLIILAAEGFGQEAGNWVHDNSIMSLLPYVPAFLGLGALGSWLREPAPPAQDTPPSSP